MLDCILTMIEDKMKKIILIILMVLFSTQAYSAQGVRGRSDTNVSERLATRADQATQSTILTSIAGSSSSIDAGVNSVISKGMYVSPHKKEYGVRISGVGYIIDNSEPATLKFQTRNIQHIQITESETRYDINLTPDPSQFPLAEINQLSIGGFNLSTDTAIRFTLYVFDGSNDMPVYDWVVGYGSTSYVDKNTNIKFFPNIVAEWDRDRDRYGFIDVTYLGTATSPIHIFFVNVTVTPFQNG